MTGFLKNKSEGKRFSRPSVLVGVACYLLAVFAAIYIGAVPSDFKYGLLPLLPISFLITSPLLLYAYSLTQSWTILITLALYFLRLVVTPMALHSNPCTSILFFSPSSGQMDSAILFICYEAIVISTIMYVYCNTKGIKEPYPSQKSSIFVWDKGSIVLKGFVASALLLFLLFPKAREDLSFLAIDVGNSERVSATELDTITNILRQIVVSGQHVAFVLIAVWAKRKYNSTHSMLYVNIALIFALFCVSLIVGEKRAMQVYVAFASLVFLRLLFPQHSRYITGAILLVAGFALAALTIYKTLYAFNYDSYLEALTSSSNIIDGFGDTLEYYALGPTSVAAGFATKEAYPVMGISSLIYEVLRCTIGISFFTKNMSIDLPTELFNRFISGGDRVSGYFIPISVEFGACIIPAIGPLLTVLVLVISMKIEGIIRSTHSPFWVFFLSYIYIRLATCLVAGNLATIITATTTVLAIAIILQMLSRLTSGHGESAHRTSSERQILYPG